MAARTGACARRPARQCNVFMVLGHRPARRGSEHNNGTPPQRMDTHCGRPKCLLNERPAMRIADIYRWLCAALVLHSAGNLVFCSVFGCVATVCDYCNRRLPITIHCAFDLSGRTAGRHAALHGCNAGRVPYFARWKGVGKGVSVGFSRR